MRLSATALLILLAATLCGCGRHDSGPAGVSAPPDVPELVATQPPPRATGVLYDSEFWGQFSRPLDGRTVSTTSVFLKLDGQRVPISVSYDGLTRRVVLRPTVTLELQRTYTVEFSTAVHAADGTPIAPNVYFQFTTNSLRRVTYDYPLAGALEGPFVTLGWGGTQGPSGNISYDLYASTDSLEVERRQAPAIAHSVFTRFVPAAAWTMGATVYWSLTSENATTHERLASSVRSFRVLDANTPIDSMEIQTRDHGSSDNRLRISSFCNQVEVPSGPNFNCSFHWEYAGLPLGVHFAGATMKLTTTDVNVGSIPAAQPAVWMAQNEWSPCAVRSPGPPWNELSGFLAQAVAVGDNEADFTSDRLAAFLEAQYRGRTLLYGTLVRTEINTSFQSQTAADLAKRPRIVVRFYRPTPSATP
jgi:hypothetical protein